MKRSYFGFLALSSLFMVTGCQNLANQNFNNPNLTKPPFVNGPLVPREDIDRKITNAVDNALINNRNLTNVAVKVETNQGEVVLSGYVKTIRQSDVAAELASKIVGVKKVQNNLIVRK